MVRLKNIRKAHGPEGASIVALDEVSLTVEPGEFLIVTGPSGSGKTTLLNVIGGMTRPGQGTAEVDGKNILAMPDSELSRFRARTIGFVFQFQSMLPTLSARENLRLALALAGLPPDEAAVARSLDQVGLAGREDAHAHQLSAGQQRRVAIARALMGSPALLLCDEPTGDLDPDAETAIMDAIGQANQKGATVIMTTHNHALKSRATRTARMLAGRLEGGTNEAQLHAGGLAEDSAT